MPSWLATLLLLGVAAVWGWTFVVVQEAIAVYGVMAFLAVRFAIAAASTFLLWGRHLSREAMVAGIGPGLLLAAGYLLQTWGLTFTTATNAGLITGLFVVIAPLADRLLYGTVLSRIAWAAAGLSLVGMSLLSGAAPARLAVGDLLVLGCAFAFGGHIALLSRVAPHHDSRALGISQMSVMGVLFLASWPLTGTIRMPPKEVWFALILTGVVASAIAYVVQTSAQRRLSAVRTAVLLTTEPLFAGIFGYLLAGERLSPVQLVGAVVILVAVTLSEIVPAIRLQRQRQRLRSRSPRTVKRER